MLLQAPVALPLVALALHRYGLGRAQAFLGRRPPGRVAPIDPQVRRSEADRLAWSVDVVARYAPRTPNCLQRSVVLWWFLHRRGLAGELRIGVRRASETGSLEFHAWVEYAGVVINDQRDIRARYATFDRAIAPRTATFQ